MRLNLVIIFSGVLMGLPMLAGIFGTVRQMVNSRRERRRKYRLDHPTGRECQQPKRPLVGKIGPVRFQDEVPYYDLE